LTLIELMIVVSIIGILAAIVIPRYSNASEDAQASRAATSMKTIVSAVQRYNIEHDDWPADVQPGRMPAELEPYLMRTDLNNAALGGSWDYEDWRGRGLMAGDATVGIALTLRYGDDTLYEEVDRLIDDGGLSTGLVQYRNLYGPVLIYLISPG
jgi:prepilin-type N-terminal cleavage/methylation domain-containing protein